MAATVVDIPGVDLNFGNEPARTRDQLDKIDSTGVVFVTGQEGRDRVADIGLWKRKNPFWDSVPFDGPGTSDCPILYRVDELRLVNFYSVLVAEQTDVGDGKAHSGAGPDTLNPKSVGVAQFHHIKARRRLTVIDNHMLASWTRTAQYLGVEEWRRRRAYGEHQIAILVDQIKAQRGGIVVANMDANADAAFPLMKPYIDAVAVGNTAGTHGLLSSKPIDFFGVRPHQAITKVDRRVDNGEWWSDHRPVFGTISVYKRNRLSLRREVRAA